MTAAPHGRFDPDSDLELLLSGRLTVIGRLTGASNATLYCEVADGGRTMPCVYKPVAGERPLWDFPDGTLAGREVAAHAVSQALGWGIVPPTVYREDAPHGPGMVQAWIMADPAVDLVALARDTDNPQLRLMAVFDAVINNSDRKIGHLLPTPDGRLYGCDHGVSFSEEYKLRTVLWQWAGQPLPAEAVERLGALLEMLHDADSEVSRVLARHLTPQERYATLRRVEVLHEYRVHPYPPEDWPALPWPPI
ncbi:SCO1664 family protein [Thermobifida cellulosilytica]|uniref:Phosphatidylinositol kinase n=1 Tax=Thermobifida cellulosilytica TB100 TaxID=665004 RepID=A0A147KMZ9_THECS|nr:SCO1664 family protein [Thermobifida cellulosilytica]KUP98660.1 phosphatidylinositol kinase [Thermobifida cellulosilytica TB100]